MPRIPGMYTTRPIGGRAAYGARLRRPAVAGVALLVAVGAAGWAIPRAVEADVSLAVGGEVTLIGHGNGHGRGMGQWGAFGYSKQGWTSTQILSHYYGGTTAGKVDNVDVSVILTGESSVNVFADAGMRVGDVAVAPGQAVSLSGSTATITAGCGGGAVQSVELPRPLVSPITPGPGRPDPELLKMCGSNQTFRGSLGFDGGRVINVVPLDDYVKGVVPKESIVTWADEGGAEALKAQAVAARTYALASMDISKPIDDTQNSQVYGGYDAEDPRSNIAVDATAGEILLKDGKPAFTEFSSSTGGATDGRDYPAVIDEGDAISPHHEWTASVSSPRIAAEFGVGSLTGFEVVEAYGMGAENGRAATVRISGTGGSVDVPAQEVRTRLQLKSSFFSVQGQQNPPAIIAPPSGVAAGPAAPDVIAIPGLPDVPGTPDGSGGSDELLGQLLALAEAAIGMKFTELGGSAGLLGSAIGPVVTTVTGAGALQQFQNGTVFFSPESGAHALAGAALLDYILKGGETVLGFPLQDLLAPTPAA